MGEAPAFDDKSADEALKALSDFLKPRIEQAQSGEQHYIFFLRNGRPIVLAILRGRKDFLARLQERL